jgi:hypothetical protein
MHENSLDLSLNIQALLQKRFYEVGKTQHRNYDIPRIFLQ